MNMRLKDKVIAITGGNSGIGLAIAEEFVRQGAKVSILGRSQETLAVAKTKLGAGAIAVQGDVTKAADRKKLFEATQKAFGSLNGLVVNAGVAKVASVQDTTEALFDEVSDINFKAAFFTVKDSLPFFAKAGGSIVLTGSAVNYRSMEGMSVYNATKGAIRSLARTFSKELVGQGIRVNVLSPGPIETPIFGRVGLPREAIEQFGSQIQAMVPLGRFGKPEEMAKAALFLISDDSSYVVASDLVADGGFSQV
jgi:NAD(P)-dependent dehydrogenase (short-subunit alcohol dehydrogenase family)